MAIDYLNTIPNNDISAYTRLPDDARTDHDDKPTGLLLWHANYHPDGGQLFFPIDHTFSSTQRFFDRQGAVHARDSVDFAREFGCLLEAPI